MEKFLDAFGNGLTFMAVIASTLLLSMLAVKPSQAQFVGVANDGTLLPEASVPEIGGVRALRDGLVGVVEAAREHLKGEGERRAATEALDRAVQLAELGARARGLDEAEAAIFRTGLAGVRAARHDLQMGRPQQAAAVLQEVADRLGEASVTEQMPEAAAPMPGDDGLRVLNMHGHRLGTLKEVASTESGTTAMIGHGGVFGIGERVTAIPADALLAGKHFAVLPSPVEAKQFGSTRLRRSQD